MTYKMKQSEYKDYKKVLKFLSRLRDNYVLLSIQEIKINPSIISGEKSIALIYKLLNVIAVPDTERIRNIMVSSKLDFRTLFEEGKESTLTSTKSYLK